MGEKETGFAAAIQLLRAPAGSETLGYSLGWAGALRSARGHMFLFGALEIYWDRNLIDHRTSPTKNPRILLGH
jgi:hypothetical protein